MLLQQHNQSRKRIFGQIVPVVDCLCFSFQVREILPSFTQYMASTGQSGKLVDMPIFYHVEGDINAAYSEILLNIICSDKQLSANLSDECVQLPCPIVCHHMISIFVEICLKSCAMSISSYRQYYLTGLSANYSQRLCIYENFLKHLLPIFLLLQL